MEMAHSRFDPFMAKGKHENSFSPIPDGMCKNVFIFSQLSMDSFREFGYEEKNLASQKSWCFPGSVSKTPAASLWLGFICRWYILISIRLPKNGWRQHELFVRNPHRVSGRIAARIHPWSPNKAINMAMFKCGRGISLLTNSTSVTSFIFFSSNWCQLKLKLEPELADHPHSPTKLLLWEVLLSPWKSTPKVQI